MKYLNKMKERIVEDDEYVIHPSFNQLILPQFSSTKNEKEIWMNRKIQRLHKNAFKSLSTPIFHDKSNVTSNEILQLQCIICYDIIHKKDVATISCNHYFCKSCWNEHCRNKLIEEEEITCPLCRHSIETSVEPIPIIHEDYFRFLTSVTLINTRSRSVRELLHSSIQQSRYF